MRYFLIIICSMLLLVSTLHAEQPKYTVMRTTGKMVIDGILDEKEWEAAPSFGSFQFLIVKRESRRQPFSRSSAARGLTFA